jgi:hypothetical protein
MNIQKVRDNTYRAAIDAMNNGEYVTIIAYICVPRGTGYIGGQTFKNCHLQSCWVGDHHVK